MLHEILIGEIWDIEINAKIPTRRIIINEAQMNIIKFFATKSIDAEGWHVY